MEGILFWLVATLIVIVTVWYVARANERSEQTRPATATQRTTDRANALNASAPHAASVSATQVVRRAPIHPESVYRDDDGDFATSAAIGLATGSAVAGTLVGGSLSGAILGAALSDDLGAPSQDDCGTPSETTPDCDASRSSPPDDCSAQDVDVSDTDSCDSSDADSFDAGDSSDSDSSDW